MERLNFGMDQNRGILMMGFRKIKLRAKIRVRRELLILQYYLKNICLQ